MFLAKIFRRFCPKKVLFYSAIGQTQYFQIVSKLASQGVRYSTKIQNDFRGRDNYSERSRVYDIYIRIEDEGRAGEALRKRG